MGKLEVLTAPYPRLTKKAKPIESVKQETKIEEVKKESPKVEAKAEKSTSEKK